ncbi:MAG: hypothetical protein ACE5GW_11070, partial [Planctomycetota bacterium]
KGPLFGDRLRILEPNRGWIEPGEAFELRMVRRGTRLLLFINGRRALSRAIPRGPLGKFGFRPEDSTMRLFHFSARGDLQDVAPRVRIPEEVTRDIDREAAVDRAIDGGAAFLLDAIEKKQVGTDDDYFKYASGQVALEIYALLVAGVSTEHPLIEGSFRYLEENALLRSKTYDVCCYIFALDAAISQLESDHLLTSSRSDGKPPRDLSAIGKRHRRLLRAALKALLGGQNATGGWRYYPYSADADSSCTQFAALAVGIGAKRDLPIADRAWRGLGSFFLERQKAEGPETDLRITLSPEGEESRRERVNLREVGKGSSRRKKNSAAKKGSEEEGRGGTSVAKPRDPDPRDPVAGAEGLTVHARPFTYHDTDVRYNWGMTCAGLSSLLLLDDHAAGAWPARRRGELHAAIRDGYGWLMENWTPNASYYGLYSLEKVADIGGVRLFGEHDWFAEACDFLLAQQRTDGSWPRTTHWGENPRVTTAFALLVLTRASTLLTKGLTVSPASRVVLTGVRGKELRERLGEKSREWVYLPELDMMIHLPRLLRTIRMRPRAKLMGLLRDVCKHYDEEHRGELIPSLLEARGRVTGRGARKIVSDCLARIAGEELSSDDDYLAWHRTWRRVVEIGEERIQSALPELLSAYREHPGSLCLKRAAGRSLMRLGAKEAMPLLLADLRHKKAPHRALAYRTLTGMFIDPLPPFDPEGEPDLRSRQIAGIEDWVRSQEGE